MYARNCSVGELAHAYPARLSVMTAVSANGRMTLMLPPVQSAWPANPGARVAPFFPAAPCSAGRHPPFRASASVIDFLCSVSPYHDASAPRSRRISSRRRSLDRGAEPFDSRGRSRRRSRATRTGAPASMSGASRSGLERARAHDSSVFTRLRSAPTTLGIRIGTRTSRSAADHSLRSRAPPNRQPSSSDGSSIRF